MRGAMRPPRPKKRGSRAAERRGVSCAASALLSSGIHMYIYMYIYIYIYMCVCVCACVRVCVCVAPFTSCHAAQGPAKPDFVVSEICRLHPAVERHALQVRRSCRYAFPYAVIRISEYAARPQLNVSYDRARNIARGARYRAARAAAAGAIVPAPGIQIQIQIPGMMRRRVGRPCAKLPFPPPLLTGPPVSSLAAHRRCTALSERPHGPAPM